MPNVNWHIIDYISEKINIAQLEISLLNSYSAVQSGFLLLQQFPNRTERYYSNFPQLCTVLCGLSLSLWRNWPHLTHPFRGVCQHGCPSIATPSMSANSEETRMSEKIHSANTNIWDAEAELDSSPKHVWEPSKLTLLTEQMQFHQLL